VHKESDYPPRLENEAFCKELEDANIDYSLDFDDRFLRCRGQATRDFYILRFGKFKRIPDVVVWPKCHREVEVVVKLANKYLSVVIPYGGGTNITLSLNYTKHENQRFYISLGIAFVNDLETASTSHVQLSITFPVRFRYVADESDFVGRPIEHVGLHRIWCRRKRFGRRSSGKRFDNGP
jgi:hypothetical protein